MECTSRYGQRIKSPKHTKLPLPEATYGASKVELGRKPKPIPTATLAAADGTGIVVVDAERRLSGGNGVDRMSPDTWLGEIT